MGVKGLWQLLLPSGRRISIETLQSKTLAIDASIWLIQFIKVNRFDPDNPEKTIQTTPAVHIIGFFRRICKLLYHGIKPVFVFDGMTPEIKMREIRERRKRRENNMHGFGLGSDGGGGGGGDGNGSKDGNEGMKRLAKRLLVQNLKRHKELEARKMKHSNVKNDDTKNSNTSNNDGGVSGAFASGFQLPNQKERQNIHKGMDIDTSSKSMQQVVHVEDNKNNNEEEEEVPKEESKNEILDINKIISETKVFLEQQQNDSSVENNNLSQHQQQQNDWDNIIHNNNDDNSSTSSSSYQIPTNENDISTQTLSSLPTKTRVDVIEKAKRQQRMQSRKEFMSVAANPDSYSQCQLRNFLKGASLSKKINEVGKIMTKNDEEGEMIASDSRRRFIFTKDVDDDNDGKDQEKGENDVDDDDDDDDDDDVDDDVDDDEDYNRVFDRNDSIQDERNKRKSTDDQHLNLHKRRRLVKVSNHINTYDNDEDENDFLSDPSRNRTENKPLHFFDDDDDGDDDDASSHGGGGFIKSSNDNEDEFITSHSKQQQQQSNQKIPHHDKVIIHLSSDDESSFCEKSNDDGSNIESRNDRRQSERLDVVILDQEELTDKNDIDDDYGGGGSIVEKEVIAEQSYPSKQPAIVQENHIELSSDDENDDGGGFIVEEKVKGVENTESKDRIGQHTSHTIVNETSQSNAGVCDSGGLVRDLGQRKSFHGKAHVKCSSNSLEEKTLLLNDRNIQNETNNIEEQLEDEDEDIDWEDCDADDSSSLHLQIDPPQKTSVDSKVNEVVQEEKLDFNGSIEIKSDDSDIDWEDGDNHNESKEVVLDSIDDTKEVVEKADIFPSPLNEDANSLALKRAQATAANLADWAGRAVKRAISAHLIESNAAVTSDVDSLADSDDGKNDGKDDDVELMNNNQTTLSPVQNKPFVSDNSCDSRMITTDSFQLDTSLEGLRAEEAQMNEDAYRRERDMDTVTDDMIEEVILLLQLFGIPYVKAPTEAEAQCATLEKLGLVDGVCTEDSDALVFGSKCVYKNIFDDKKFVEVYLSKDAEKLGIGLNEKIALAMLLGGDYTEGVRGVGIVNGMEILQAFPVDKGVREGLSTFRKWLDGDDLIGNGENLLSEKERKFHKKHKSARLRWVVPKDFPSKKVFQAYSHPVVDTSPQKFTFGTPDEERIKLFCRRKMGWNSEEVDRALQPVLQKLKSDSMRQTRLDGFFMRYEDNHVISHKIKSKRLKEVFESVKKS